VSSRRVLPLFIGIHLVVSAAIAAAFAWRFGQSPNAVAAHILLLAEWDVATAAIIVTLAARGWQRGARWPWVAYLLLIVLTCTLQVYLYALDAVSNVSWGRNITGHLVSAFAPTVWSGQEPFPIGRIGITLFASGTLALMAAIVSSCARATGDALAPWMPHSARTVRVAILTAALAGALVGSTITWGIASRDDLLWKDELVASFFRPVGYAFEPTARRHAVAERDAVLQASYPRRVPGVRRRNVILIIVDSLRADHMQAYGYQRPTTPFLSQLVAGGRMNKVDMAFSTCSESFCGITSTLSSREFRDISAPTFNLQDALRDEGYQTWFLLSGNHSAWNGLPEFYHASADTYFDGSQTQRYTMDDDRLVLEGLERVPAASPDHPAFFYVHLMSTHYLGVQFPQSHVFTRPDAAVSRANEPYSALVERLDKPDHYDDKVLQADGMIHAIFDAFAAKHYLDDAVVVVTGDHGEGLGERHFAHGWDLYNEDIRIPLLLYEASAVRYPDLSFAAQVDIAPTMLDRLGLPIPESWEGESLLAATPTRFTYHQTYFLPNRFAVLYRDRRRLYKYIATPQYGHEELYDLVHDRGESHNLVAEEPAVATLLRDKLRAYRDD